MNKTYFEIIVNLSKAIKQCSEQLKSLEKHNLNNTKTYQYILDELKMFVNCEQEYYDKLETNFLKQKLNQYEITSDIEITNIDYAFFEAMKMTELNLDSVHRRIYNKTYIEFLKRTDSNLLDISIPLCYDFPAVNSEGYIIIDGKKIYVYDQINILELIRNNVFLNLDAKYLTLLGNSPEDIDIKYNLIYLNHRLEELLLKENFIIKKYLPEKIDNIETRETNKTIYQFFKKNHNKMMFENIFNELVRYDESDFVGRNKKISKIAFDQTLLYIIACEKDIDDNLINQAISYLEKNSNENDKIYKKIKEKLIN